MSLTKIAKTNGIVVLPSGGGVQVDVELLVDVKWLMERYASKALKNKSGKTKFAKGAVVVTAKRRAA